MNINKAILNRIDLNTTDQSFIKPKDYEFQTLESELSFRRTADGLNVRNGSIARVSSVKGNSVVWNQLIPIPCANDKSKVENGVTFVDNRDGSYTIYTDGNGATDATHIYIYDKRFPLGGHKVLLQGCPQGGSISTYYFGDRYYGITETGKGVISTVTVMDLFAPAIVVTKGTVITTPITFNPRYYDLTLMFCSGNEPTTIEEFYARKPKVADENAFNEGEVIHMEADAIKSVGVNQWDEEWEVGTFLDNGTIYTGSGYDVAIHSKNYINVIEGSRYQFTYPYNGTLYTCLYDSAKTFISREIISDTHEYTIPNGVRYIRIATEKNYNSSTYKNDICINLSDTEVNGKYFPYVKREQSLEMLKKYFPNGMKSAGTAHDEIRWNEQKQKWEAVKRIGEVDMGRLEWQYNTTYGGFVGYISGTNNHNNVFKIEWKGVCVKYPYYGKYDIVEDKGLGYIYNNNVFIKDSSYTDAASFKAAMSGVILYHELAEPIVTEIDENFNLDYEVWNAGTEQMIADTTSTPVLANIRYKVNK